MFINLATDLVTVYRVNWLQAKACSERWIEEERLVIHEMAWTVLWLKQKKTQWDEWGTASTNTHLLAYAARQVSHWNKAATQAEKRFDWVKSLLKADRKRKRPPE